MICGCARVSTRAQDVTGPVAQLMAAGCPKIFREKINGTTADRSQLRKLMAVLTQGDVVITPAVARLSRDATGLLVIAREMQRAGADIKSLAVPRYHVRFCRDHLRHPWRCREAGTPPHFGGHGHRPRRRKGEGRQIRTQAELYPASAARSTSADVGGRNTAQLCPPLQRHPTDDLPAAGTVKRTARMLAIQFGKTKRACL